MHPTNRILIIGGGIGGLTLAAALHRLGLRAAVYEQAPAFPEAGAGIGLWSNALRSLDEIDAGDEVRCHCRPLRRGQILNQRGQTLIDFDLGGMGSEFREAACYVVRRSVLLAAIQRQVPRGWIHTGRRAVEITQSEAIVTVRFDTGECVEGDVLVGADGLRSAVRRYVAGDAPPRYSGQTCFSGVTAFAPLEPGMMREIQGAGRRCAICPISDQLVSWWAATNAPEGALVPVEGRKGRLLEQFDGWPGEFQRLVERTPSDRIFQNDLYDRAPIRRWSAGRITLLGDAAHPTTPNLGQGANMAIDDGIVLARSLHRATTRAEAFQRYESIRMPRTARIVDRSWRFGQVATWERDSLVWMKETLARLTPGAVVRAELRRQILESVGTL
jgi:2-polyprenyl-6-methoxyphenol hydroxylase-like FAD-dependent oxidoreductase